MSINDAHIDKNEDKSGPRRTKCDNVGKGSKRLPGNPAFWKGLGGSWGGFGEILGGWEVDFLAMYHAF